MQWPLAQARRIGFAVGASLSNVAKRIGADVAKLAGVFARANAKRIQNANQCTRQVALPFTKLSERGLQAGPLLYNSARKRQRPLS